MYSQSEMLKSLNLVLFLFCFFISFILFLQDLNIATALAAAAGVKAPEQTEPSDPTEVYVSNTSEEVAQSHLQEFFCMIGELESITKDGLVCVSIGM